jgi:hypothetical protein
MGKADEFRLYYTGTYVNRHRFEVNGIYVQDPTSLSAGQWRFLVGWFDGTNAHIQVNNGPVYSAPANAPAATANPLKALSEVPETGSLIGDELFLYKRVLSAGERATLYGNGMRLGDLSFDLAVSRPIAQMPVFTAPPASLVKRVGENAAFNLRAESAFPVSYQWNLNGSPLVGATNGLLFLETVTPADAGTYTLTASNIGGPVTSSPATLTVIPPPTIRVDDGCLGFTGEEFGFCIEGPVGLRATVEVSTNLVDWVPLQTHLVETGTVRCSDPQAGAFTSRFYRARLDAPATP